MAQLLVDGLASGGNWAQTLKRSPLNTDFYVTRERDAEERFPWEIIDAAAPLLLAKSHGLRVLVTAEPETAQAAS